MWKLGLPGAERVSSGQRRLERRVGLRAGWRSWLGSGALVAVFLVGAAFLPGLSGPAQAATQTANPNTNLNCHDAWSLASGTWSSGTINVQGDCAGPVLVQQISGFSTGSSCEGVWNCGYSSTDPITANDITMFFWDGTDELGLHLFVEPSVTSTYFQLEDGATCGFNGLDVPFNTTIGTAPTVPVVDATATAYQDSNPPTVAGTSQGTTGLNIAACTTASTAYVEAFLNNYGTTNIGDFSAVDINNSYCINKNLTACYTSYPSLYEDQESSVLLAGTSELTTNDGTPPNCDLIDVTGPANEPTQVSGSTYPYTIDFTGDADYIVAVDDSYSGGATSVEGKSFDLPSLGDVDAGPALDSPQTIDFVAGTGDTVNPDLWCYSVTTGWIDWGLYSSVGNLNNTTNTNTGGGSGSGSGGSFGLGACFSYSGFSATDPGTWVSGVLHDGQCVLQWLFEPSQSSLSSAEGVFGIGSDTPTPGETGVPASDWLGYMTQATVVWPTEAVSSIKSTADAGGCNLPGTAPSVTIIPGHSATTLSLCGIVGEMGPSGTIGEDSNFGSLVGVLGVMMLIVLVIRVLLWLKNVSMVEASGGGGDS